MSEITRASERAKNERESESQRVRESERQRERGSEKICLYRCDRALALARPAHGTRVAGTKKPYGRATRHQRQAKMHGKRKTEIATGEENEGGVRTCPTSCTRTHHSCTNK